MIGKLVDDLADAQVWKNRPGDCIGRPGALELLISRAHALNWMSEWQGKAPARWRRIIKFRSISKAFDENPLLRDVSFQVDRGEPAVIMGRSGVGKSVALKHITGFSEAGVWSRSRS